MLALCAQPSEWSVRQLNGSWVRKYQTLIIFRVWWAAVHGVPSALRLRPQTCSRAAGGAACRVSQCNWSDIHTDEVFLSKTINVYQLLPRCLILLKCYLWIFHCITFRRTQFFSYEWKVEFLRDKTHLLAATFKMKWSGISSGLQWLKSVNCRRITDIVTQNWLIMTQ